MYVPEPELERLADHVKDSLETRLSKSDEEESHCLFVWFKQVDWFVLLLLKRDEDELRKALIKDLIYSQRYTWKTIRVKEQKWYLFFVTHNPASRKRMKEAFAREVEYGT